MPQRLTSELWNALCNSDAEKSIDSAPMSIVAGLVQPALIATSISPLDRFIGEKGRVEQGCTSVAMNCRNMVLGRHMFECEWSKMRFCCGGVGKSAGRA